VIEIHKEFHNQEVESRPLLPEQHLLLAVLDDAIWTYLYGKGKYGQNYQRQAEKWLWSDESWWVVSFRTVCEQLDLNPNWIRGGLLKAQKRLTSPKDGRSRPTRRIRSWSKNYKLA
jgi:hypothetical protein